MDDILVEVFHRIASPLTIVRASAVCKTWRRLITSHSFAHIFDPSLSLLGFFVSPSMMFYRGIVAYFVPSIQPDPELSSAVRRRRDFSSSLLGRGRWDVSDYLDTVLLFFNWDVRDKLYDPTRPKQIAACDPVNRRCAFFGPPPSSFFETNEVSSGHPRRRRRKRNAFWDAYYLIPSKDPRSQWFRVVCITGNGDRLLRAAVFSSDTEDWCLYPWSQMLSHAPVEKEIRWCGMHGNGSIYWFFHQESCMLALDTASMQFSFIDIPAYSVADTKFMVEYGQNIELVMLDGEHVVGETEDGELCFVYARSNGNGFMVFVWISKTEEGDGGVRRWVLEKEVSLPEELCSIIPALDERERLRIIAVRKGYLFFKVSDIYCTSWWLLSLRLKSMQLEKAAEGKIHSSEVYPYTITWPPSFCAL